MKALLLILLSLSSIGLTIGLAQRVIRRRDAERRQRERSEYEERGRAARTQERQAALMQTVVRFFPHVREAVETRIRSGTDPRQALREALAAVPGVRLGTTESGLEVHAPDELRTRHVVIWGMSGRGKSALMTRMIHADIEHNRAIIAVCPEPEFHRDLLALSANRAADVIYYAPGDPACPVSFNGMALEPGVERDRHADEVFSTIKRCLGEETIGPRIDPMLANSIALLTGVPGVTLASLRRVLTDPDYRERLLAQTENEYVKQYFVDVYSKYSGNVALPLLSRLDAFLRTAVCRRALCHPTGSFTIRQVLEERKILLVDLSGLTPDTTQLIGGMITCKLLLEILRRETALAAEQRAVRIFLDEFPSICGFSESAWETLLSRARKYHAAICLAGQVPSSVPLRVRQQIAGNASNLISFALSSRDAAAIRRELLVPGADNSLNPVGEESIVSLPVGVGYARLGAGTCAIKVRFSAPIPIPSMEVADHVRDLSWRTYGLPHPPELEPSVQRASVRIPDAKVNESISPGAGRGGQRHRFLQQLAKRWAEQRGLRATLEETVPGGRVDVSLVGENIRIAVEVVVSSTPEQVVAGITRSIAAGFASVVILSSDTAFLRKLQDRVVDLLDAKDRAHVRFLDANGLRAFLDELPSPSQDRTAGYRLEVVRERVSRASYDTRRRTLAEMVGNALLRRNSA